MGTYDALYEFFQSHEHLETRDACDILGLIATKAAGVNIRVTHSTVIGVPQLNLADIAKLGTVFKSAKFSVRDTFLVLRGRAPTQPEAIAVGRLLSKLYKRSTRGAVSFYEFAEFDRRTLLDAGIAEA